MRGWGLVRPPEQGWGRNRAPLPTTPTLDAKCYTLHSKHTPEARSSEYGISLKTSKTHFSDRGWSSLLQVRPLRHREMRYPVHAYVTMVQPTPRPSSSAVPHRALVYTGEVDKNPTQKVSAVCLRPCWAAEGPERTGDLPFRTSEFNASLNCVYLQCF